MVSLLKSNDVDRSRLPFSGARKLHIGQTVYLLTGSDECIAGTPGMLSAIDTNTAKVCVEWEHGTLEFTVAVADVLPASVFTATLLRAACCACDRLVLDRGSLVGVATRLIGRQIAPSNDGSGRFAIFTIHVHYRTSKNNFVLSHR
jgi:hypothetical protein